MNETGNEALAGGRSDSRKQRLPSRAPLTFFGCSILILFIGLSLAATILLVAAALEVPSLYGGTAISESSKLFAADGSPITIFKAEQYRLKVPISEMPRNMQDAVIAIEDERFYEHHGIDARALLRAVFANFTKQRMAQGGSTLTQQLVKNVYISSEKTLSRKLKEALLAIQVEQEWSKKDILEKYLNVVYFGHGVYGVGTASREFFGKKPQDMRLDESALLAAIIKSPTWYSPYDYPEEARKRRDLVLNEMVKQGYISDERARAAMANPIRVRRMTSPPVPYPYFVEYVKQMLIDRYGANMVFKGGLKIYSSLDPKAQAAAEKSVAAVLDEKNDPSAALISVEPESGAIRALIGGRDFNAFKFNLAIQGRRQPGSAFKTFVMLAALEKGIAPTKQYETTPVTIPIKDEPEPWKVKNYGQVKSPVTLREATIFSINTAYARLVMEVGPEKVVAMARKMGIETPLEARPSIALGGLKNGVSPLEMAAAYGVLANFGYRCRPTPILKITDANGKLIEKTVVRKQRAIDPKLTLQANDILSDVISKGTGVRAAIGRPAAGKTGTTQNYRDAWFVGYTPDLVTSVWVGYPKAQVAMTDVHGISVTGGSLPARIWKQFMIAALKGVPANEFGLERQYSAGQKAVRVKICRDSFKLATPYCPNVQMIDLERDDIPSGYCNIHRQTNLVKVPDIVGLNLTDARIKLESVGLVLESDFESAPYRIKDQSPAGGKSVLLGTAVKVTVDVQ